MIVKKGSALGWANHKLLTEMCTEPRLEAIEEGYPANVPLVGSLGNRNSRERKGRTQSSLLQVIILGLSNPEISPTRANNVLNSANFSWWLSFPEATAVLECFWLQFFGKGPRKILRVCVLKCLYTVVLLPVLTSCWKMRKWSSRLVFPFSFFLPLVLYRNPPPFAYRKHIVPITYPSWGLVFYVFSNSNQAEPWFCHDPLDH